MFIVTEAKTNEDLIAILKLRYIILRQPWEQPLETATDALEEKSINAFITDTKGNAIACGRLQVNEIADSQNGNKIGQIRFMAVDSKYQGTGLGKLIVAYLEKKAKELGLPEIQLQARENALKFYENCGYSIQEKSFFLWDQIQHYLMFKKLN